MREEPTCPLEIPLVSGPVPIPDAQFTASSELDATYGSKQARINTTTGWCPSLQALDTVPNMFIQVSVKICSKFDLNIIYISFFVYLNDYTFWNHTKIAKYSNI